MELMDSVVSVEDANMLDEGQQNAHPHPPPQIIAEPTITNGPLWAASTDLSVLHW